MNLSKFKSYFFETLKNIFPKTEIESFFFILLEDRLNLSRVEAALNPNTEINAEHLAVLKNDLIALQNQKPIQYIIGKTTFYNLEFYVNKNVLIPRPETEELVDWIINDSVKTKPTTIIDIGTGSGCIAISLAKNLTANVSAMDISKKAIETAKKNANLNKVTVNYINANILNENLSQKYDVIVSNPPYVKMEEMEQMKNNVLKHEPHLALFVANKNPLIFYKRIADLAKNNLTQNGVLYFEINQYLSKETSELLKNIGFNNIELRKDFYGNYRMLRASF